MIQKFALLALAGSLGTLARYSLAGFVNRVAGSPFPWGTAAVNLTGCFLAGLLFALFENRWPVSGETRTLIFVGFMGSFTTFSAMILDANELLQTTGWIHAAANLTMQNGFGFVALFAGIAFGRMA